MTDGATDLVGSVVHGLLVEESDEFALMLRLLIEQPSLLDHRFDHVASVQDAVAALQEQTFDVVLLGPSCGGLHRDDALATLRPHTSEVPVITVLDLDDATERSAVLTAGAEAVIDRRELDAALLRHSVSRAVELRRLRRYGARAREDARRERELRMREPEVTGTSVSMRMHGAAPLRETVPDEFASLVEGYDQALEMAVRAREYADAPDAKAMASQLALRFGRLRAGPADLIDVHATVIERRRRETSRSRLPAYVDECRLQLVAVMGGLVSYYRTRAGLLGASADGTAAAADGAEGGRAT